MQHSASGSPRTLRASVIAERPLSLHLRWAAFGSIRQARFNRVPDLRRDLDTAKPRDLLDAGRRSDVDLSQPVADNVDADKNEPLSAQSRADRSADLAVASA